MVKYRLEFSKTGETKFVSHLDLVRLFSRVFKRAELPLAYSEGFNPHPKMSIGIPLSVGVTSEAELLDVEFYNEVEAEDIKVRLNEKMPMGILISKVKKLEQGDAKLSTVSKAQYNVKLFGAEITEEKVSDFMKKAAIEIEKKTKRSEKVVDIKPDIFALSYISEDELFMELATGSNANLKPDVVLEAMQKYIDGFGVEDYALHRIKMTDATDRELI
ncbi:MAG: TIGR03936 family radical SAM-associated protein [Clostridia bacterium]|nr:TIGR03936 family radical SAM-associated protein [Clostridia bacterium]